MFSGIFSLRWKSDKLTVWHDNRSIINATKSLSLRRTRGAHTKKFDLTTHFCSLCSLISVFWEHGRPETPYSNFWDFRHGHGQSHDFRHGYRFGHAYVRKPQKWVRTRTNFGHACPLISDLCIRSLYLIFIFQYFFTRLKNSRFKTKCFLWYKN